MKGDPEQPSVLRSANKISYNTVPPCHRLKVSLRLRLSNNRTAVLVFCFVFFWLVLFVSLYSIYESLARTAVNRFISHTSKRVTRPVMSEMRGHVRRAVAAFAAFNDVNY